MPLNSRSAGSRSAPIDIEHADHDGSASGAEVYRYFSMVLDAMPNPEAHLCHLHETKRVASQSVLAALQAGIATVRGHAGRPGRTAGQLPRRLPHPRYGRVLLQGSPLCRSDHAWKTCLCRSTNWGSSTATMWTASCGSAPRWKRRCGRRLRSEAIYNGRTLKGGHPEFGRPGLQEAHRESRREARPESTRRVASRGEAGRQVGTDSLEEVNSRPMTGEEYFFPCHSFSARNRHGSSRTVMTFTY